MASLLLAACAKGQRRSLPNATVMIHSLQIVRVCDALNELYSKHTGKPIDVIAKNMDRDHFMTPGEAKAFGR
ncbi:unnamed protein product [Eruca vesicaria subsp. sativa]|uniref:Uncharacterized protein n=1 Tax=Eruca vesicaria subsp. sativa TaxID=29727 RepID=A0ABC8KUL6_ERUVS|nr:unnamed protein product [Eruca vesicaria subsp. sativa]